MAKREKMNLETYCLSASIIDVVAGISTGSHYKSAYKPDSLDDAINNGFVEYRVSNSELLELTKRGKSLYKKLQQCVLKDVRRNSPRVSPQ